MEVLNAKTRCDILEANNQKLRQVNNDLSQKLVSQRTEHEATVEKFAGLKYSTQELHRNLHMAQKIIGSQKKKIFKAHTITRDLCEIVETRDSKLIAICTALHEQCLVAEEIDRMVKEFREKFQIATTAQRKLEHEL